MNPSVQSALISAVVVLVGFLVNGIFMARRLQHLQHAFERAREDRRESRQRRDAVRLYADPLLQALRSFGFRLGEVLDEAGRAAFLLPDAAPSSYNRYKYISTVYRLAAILGWIRAFRRERSYLDPAEIPEESEIDKALQELAQALADGPHVEQQRLQELLSLWRIDAESVAEDLKREVSVEIDNQLRTALSEGGVTAAQELDRDDQTKLCHTIAELVRERYRADIPREVVEERANSAIALFGIKEAWIYRDWQAAIGDQMIVEAKNAPRRFDVIGFAEFETRYLAVHAPSKISTLTSSESAQITAIEQHGRWLRRLESVFVGLDVSRKGIYDARREQLRNTRDACKKLAEKLESMLHSLQTS